MKSIWIAWAAGILLIGGFRAEAAGPELADMLESLRHARAQLAAAGAGAAAVDCGVVAAGDTLLLSADLSCAGTFWLESGATLDLGGHVLEASIEASGSDVVLRNGTVVGRLDFVSCRDCTIERVHVRDGSDFVLMAGPRLLVTQSRFSGNEVAIDVYYAHGEVQIVDSIFEDNRVGVNIAYPSDNRIASSAFRRNRIGVNVWDEDGEGVNRNTVEDSLFEDNQLGAVLFVRCESAPCHEGNRFLRNRFRNGRGSGLLVDATGCEWERSDCGAVEAEIRENVFSRDGGAPQPVVSSDGLDARNSDDGLTVIGPAHATAGISVATNLAQRNADLGIDALGVSDGGGNRAGGNGDVRQCLGVVCEPVLVVDVRPGDDANDILLRSRGHVPVAILGGSDLDVRDLDASSLAFGPSGAAPAHRQGGHREDVDGDGVLDLVSHYRIPETGLRPGDEEACISARTRDGATLSGCDRVALRH